MLEVGKELGRGRRGGSGLGRRVGVGLLLLIKFVSFSPSPYPPTALPPSDQES